MSIEHTIALPEGWRLEGVSPTKTTYWVVVDNLWHYTIYRSDGNEQLWAVAQWWMEETDKEITGQRPTLEDAIDTLRRYLAGESVPSGEEIAVFIGDERIGMAPIFHNDKDEQFVSVPEKS